MHFIYFWTGNFTFVKHKSPSKLNSILESIIAKNFLGRAGKKQVG